MADTVMQGVLKLKPQKTQRLGSVMSILVALCWGLLAGLVVCVPAGYYYRFWRQSTPLRNKADYSRLSIAGINAQWTLFQHLDRRNAFLGEISPAQRLSTSVRASLLHAADDVIDRYRNNSDPAIEDFDWRKAAVCLQHALELDPADHGVQGRLALVDGYLKLMQANAEPAEGRQALAEAAQTKFQEAASLIPRAADPHLGLARIYVYALKNAGKAVAEMHEAQRLGFQPGPRELEQEADGYRFRANSELMSARAFRGKSRETEQRYLRLAQRDYDRARRLYEPISGYSNVSVALREVDDDDQARQHLSDSLKQPAKPAKRQHRAAVRRSTRWQ